MVEGERSTMERDDFVSGGGAVAYMLVAVALAGAMLLLFLLRPTPAEAGCAEICRFWPRPDFSQANPHCCCENYLEVRCDAEPCPTESPTPLPTPESYGKGECCEQAGKIARGEKRRAYKAYRAAAALAEARLETMRAACRGEGDNHAH